MEIYISQCIFLYRNRNECHHNVVQYNRWLHTVLQKLEFDCPRPSWARYGVSVVSICEKNYHIKMAPQCVSLTHCIIRYPHEVNLTVPVFWGCEYQCRYYTRVNNAWNPQFKTHNFVNDLLIFTIQNYHPKNFFYKKLIHIFCNYCESNYLFSWWLSSPWW